MTKKLIPVEKFMAVAIANGYEVFEQSQIASYSKDMMLKSQAGTLSKEEKDEFAVEMAGLQKAICLGTDGKETTLYYRKPLIDWRVDGNGFVMKGIAGVYADVPENRKLNRVGRSYVSSADVIKAIYEGDDENNMIEVKDEELSTRASSIKKSCVAVVADADRRFVAGEIDEELCKAVKSEVGEYLNTWGEVLDECGEVIKSIDHEDVKEDLADATAEFADLVKSVHGRYKDTPKNRRLHRVGQEYGKTAQKDDESKKEQPTVHDELNEAKSKSSDKRTAYYSKLKEIYEKVKGNGDSKVNLKKLSEFAGSSSPRARMNAYKALQAFEAGATVEEAIDFVDKAYKEYQAGMDKVKEKAYNEGISPNMEKHLNDAVWDAYMKASFRKEEKSSLDKKETKVDSDKAAEKRARRQERRRERHARKRAEAQAAKERESAALSKVDFSEKDFAKRVDEEAAADYPNAKVKLHNYEAPRTDYYDNDGNLKQSTPFITEFYSDSSQNGVGGYEVYFDKADSIGTFRTKESAIAALNAYVNAMRVKGHSKPEWIYNQSKGDYQWNYSLPKAGDGQNTKELRSLSTLKKEISIMRKLEDEYVDEYGQEKFDADMKELIDEYKQQGGDEKAIRAKKGAELSVAENAYLLFQKKSDGVKSVPEAEANRIREKAGKLSGSFVEKHSMKFKEDLYKLFEQNVKNGLFKNDKPGIADFQDVIDTTADKHKTIDPDRRATRWYMQARAEGKSPEEAKKSMEAKYMNYYDEIWRDIDDEGFIYTQRAKNFNESELATLKSGKNVDDYIPVPNTGVTYGGIKYYLFRLKNSRKNVGNGLMNNPGNVTFSIENFGNPSEAFIRVPGSINERPESDHEMYSMKLQLKNGKTYKDFSRGKVNLSDIGGVSMVTVDPANGASVKEKPLDPNHVPIYLFNENEVRRGSKPFLV